MDAGRGRGEPDARAVNAFDLEPEGVSDSSKPRATLAAVVLWTVRGLRLERSAELPSQWRIADPAREVSRSPCQPVMVTS